MWRVIIKSRFISNAPFRYKHLFIAFSYRVRVEESMAFQSIIDLLGRGRLKDVSISTLIDIITGIWSDKIEPVSRISTLDINGTRLGLTNM